MPAERPARADMAPMVMMRGEEGTSREVGIVRAAGGIGRLRALTRLDGRRWSRSEVFVTL
jgi:hypothetical protein